MIKNFSIDTPGSVKLIVVSDLHIHGAEDPVYPSLLRLLNERVQPGDVVVLAGDIFDLLVGDKVLYRQRYRGFFEALANGASREVRFHYIEGNHDFLLKKAFAGISALELHEREFTLELGGKRFFLAHGDLANRKDYGYRFLRAFFRSPVMKALVAGLPGGVLDWIGRKSSEASRERSSAYRSDLEALRKVYRSYAAEALARGHDFVVMGHCHDLDEMEFTIDGRPCQYINVGYPRVHGSYLEWSPGEAKISRRSLGPF